MEVICVWGEKYIVHFSCFMCIFVRSVTTKFFRVLFQVHVVVVIYINRETQSSYIFVQWHEMTHTHTIFYGSIFEYFAQNCVSHKFWCLNIFLLFSFVYRYSNSTIFRLFIVVTFGMSKNINKYHQIFPSDHLLFMIQVKPTHCFSVRNFPDGVCVYTTCTYV